MLQGSLDNFALDEVLGLLSSTAKTGRLSLDGDRGSGALALHEGRLVDASASYESNGIAPEDVIFELLRYVDGNFTFEPGHVEPSDASREVNEVLVAAEARLADWRTIEAVVPSLTHEVTPAPALPSDEVKINRSEWITLRIIAAGCPASAVCEQLGLGEVEGSRQIMGLADRGLVVIGHGEGTTASPPPVERASSRLDSVTGPAPGDRPVGGLPFSPSTAGSGITSSLGGLDTDYSQVDETFDDDPFERIVGSVPVGSRPPMPPAPSVDDLKSIDEALEGTALPAPPPLDDHLLVGSVNESDEPVREGSGKPAGLLMRYLKSED